MSNKTKKKVVWRTLMEDHIIAVAATGRRDAARRSGLWPMRAWEPAVEHPMFQQVLEQMDKVFYFRGDELLTTLFAHIEEGN